MQCYSRFWSRQRNDAVIECEHAELGKVKAHIEQVVRSKSDLQGVSEQIIMASERIL
jgi:hypothetical protein